MSSYNSCKSPDEIAIMYNMRLRNGIIPLSKKKVPEGLWPLIPLAEFWGDNDDGFRDEYVSKSPKTAMMDLVKMSEDYNDELDKWLAGEEADHPPYSDEYLAFTALRLAALSADVILAKG